MWTDETRDECLAMWNTGDYSMEMLATKFGITRSAISGFLHRAKAWGREVLNKNDSELYLKRVYERASAAQKRLRARVRTRMRMPSAYSPPPSCAPLSASDITPLRASLFDLGPNECRYAYGERNFAFCGHATLPMSSYCQAHHGIVWVRPAR